MLKHYVTCTKLFLADHWHLADKNSSPKPTFGTCPCSLMANSRSSASTLVSLNPELAISDIRRARDRARLWASGELKCSP
jgi:hypothetical protein